MILVLTTGNSYQGMNIALGSACPVGFLLQEPTVSLGTKSMQGQYRPKTGLMRR